MIKKNKKEDIKKYILENTKHMKNITVLESLKIVIDYIKLNNLQLILKQFNVLLYLTMYKNYLKNMDYSHVIKIKYN